MVTKRDSSVTDFVFYVSLIVLSLWILGKATGFIHSPAWVEMIPWASAVFASGACYQKLNSVCSDMNDIKPTIKDMSSRVITLETKETLHKEHMEKIDSRVNEIITLAKK